MEYSVKELIDLLFITDEQEEIDVNLKSTEFWHLTKKIKKIKKAFDFLLGMTNFNN